MTISERELVRSQIQQKKKKNRTIILIILAVIVVVAAVIIITRLPKKGSSFTTEDGLSIGDPNAPVKVLEFTNFSCSHCKNFTLNTSAGFIKQYVETGKVYYTAYPYPWSEDDLTYTASLGAYCAAEQDAFYAYKELVFNRVASPQDLSEEAVRGYAESVGMDLAKFDSCMQDPNLASKVAETKALASTFNVSGTPSFIVNGSLFYANNLINGVEAALEASGN